MAFKLLLVSVEGTIVGPNNIVNAEIAAQLGALAAELKAHGVTVALWSTRKWTMKSGESLETYMSNHAGIPIQAHGLLADGSPPRRQAGSADPIRAKYGVASHETVLLGGHSEDMIAGVQNRLLHLRCDWYGQQTQYGIAVSDVAAVRRFCLVFALRHHSIFWRHTSDKIDVAAAGPFATMREAYAFFGIDARDAAKHGKGHPDFWFLIAASSLYFSGALVGVDYICSYPGHKVSPHEISEGSQAYLLARLGQCLRINYYGDLIERHKDAEKSQFKSAADRQFLNQLNTIRLNAHPHRNFADKPNKTAVTLKGKLVLVIDDITTSGKSLDTARAYIEAAGGRARLFSWLKTVTVPYTRMVDPAISPWKSNSLTIEPKSVNYGYHEGIVDAAAPAELDKALKLFTAMV